jgi:putative effector of murein hydrolase LrgA (UPF0299 family)
MLPATTMMIKLLVDESFTRIAHTFVSHMNLKFLPSTVASSVHDSAARKVFLFLVNFFVSTHRCSLHHWWRHLRAKPSPYRLMKFMVNLDD